MFPKSIFFTWMGGKHFALARARMGTHPHSSEKMLSGNILSVEIHFVKSQGIYLESGLVSTFNGWTSQKMHEILLCLKFQAVVDVISKSILACLITWMLNLFQIKYFAIICSLKAIKIRILFFENFRKLKNKDFIVFCKLWKLKNKDYIFCKLWKLKNKDLFFANFRKLKNKDFIFFANFQKIKNKDFTFCKL